MNKMQMIFGGLKKALTLFVVVVLCIGCALVVTSLQILAMPPDTSILLSSSQTLTARPVSGTPTALVSSQPDMEKLYLTPLANLDKWRNNDAYLQGTLTPLDSTSTILSYARKYEDQIFIVVLNNSAANQSIVINLGSR